MSCCRASGNAAAHTNALPCHPKRTQWRSGFAVRVLAVAEQAALELADSQITVTVLCPALVRSAMSEVGDDPFDVANLALDAVAEGRFAVLPDKWASALRVRAHALAKHTDTALQSRSVATRDLRIVYCNV